MRQGPPSNGRRPRGRHHGGDHGGNRYGGGSGNGSAGARSGGMDNRPRSAASLRHQSFDSNCIDLRVRGNAWQVHEKYQALARDAQSSGDRVAAENYLQHAEHYFRIIEAINEATAIEQRASGRQIETGRPAEAGVPATYGGQPEMPANYYGAAGVPPVTAAGAPQSTDGNLAQQAQQPAQAEAQVQVRQPPKSPFFLPDEVENVDDGPQSLVARR